MLKLLYKLVVSDSPATPRLLVNRLRRPAVNWAVRQIFLRVKERLFLTRESLVPVTMEIPLETDKVNVGSSLILTVLK